MQQNFYLRWAAHFVWMFFMAPAANAQDSALVKTETILAARYYKITSIRLQDSTLQYDSLEDANAGFLLTLKRMLSRQPATLQYDFSALKKAGVLIVTSPDKKFRQYSWSTRQGGKGQQYDGLFQFASKEKVLNKYVIADGLSDAKSRCEAIYQVGKKEQVVYISFNYFVGATKDSGGYVQLYKIENDDVVEATLLQTETGLKSNLFYYHDTAKADDLSLPVLKFNASKKIIYVPATDQDGKATSIKFKFKRGRFKKVK